MGYIDRLEPTSVASMQRDLQSGRASELYECVGALVQAAREIGQPMPIRPPRQLSRSERGRMSVQTSSIQARHSALLPLLPALRHPSGSSR